MQCHRCGFEGMKVISTKRGEKVDERTTVCRKCGQLHVTETKVKFVLKYDKTIMATRPIEVESEVKE